MYGVAAGRVIKAWASRANSKQTLINMRIEKERCLSIIKGLRLGAYVGAPEEDGNQIPDQSMKDIQSPPNPAALPVQKAVWFDDIIDKP